MSQIMAIEEAAFINNIANFVESIDHKNMGEEKQKAYAEVFVEFAQILANEQLEREKMCKLWKIWRILQQKFSKFLIF